MPKKKNPTILYGKDGERFLMNRAAKRMARKLGLGPKDHLVPMVTIEGTRRVLLSTGKTRKISAWEKTKRRSFWEKFQGWWEKMTKEEKKNDGTI